MPQRIGRYRVDGVLGKGGFGMVYLAYDEQLNRQVAVKVPHVFRITRADDVERYLIEARTVANLDHPQIVPVHDVGSTPEFPLYVVSKYISGSDLATLVKQSRLTSTKAAELVATVAEALHSAHEKGVVHRDVKPGNILIDNDGKVFLLDFGLALRDEDLGKGSGYSGTPSYMSPEQARGQGHRVDRRSDIFSLGVVLYELLTGRRPFQADSQIELFDQIAGHEPCPVRLYDEAISKELERICHKALSKRASERYPTAHDLAEDLRHFLQASQQTGSGAPSLVLSAQQTAINESPHIPATPIVTPGLDLRPIKIVPKGLRSFDAADANFFLELLPGPRDREGLPESIRFWKTKIEVCDPDETFSVGLIYGPSGCGKSSLVKAGLLPRLSDHVIAVYVEATPDETEARLLYGLRKRCPTLPEGRNLIQSVAALRHGQGVPHGKKVLIVVDQFEQWLHAKRAETDTELVQALQQCDGGRVQCIVMVRDDFWMAATRFMRELEVRLLEGQNSAAVDLFDVEHAKKVLAAFGRAFGKFPVSPAEASKAQMEFLRQAVWDLAQEGKVNSVRLALFSEMMKSKEWTLHSLKAVGGTEGVGFAFLEETFGAATAPPAYRFHQKAARAVLKALLPETGSDIKGHMRSHSELLEASGYGGLTRMFGDLIHILDRDARLITPTDPEGMDDAEPSPVHAGAKYYQLSHDYLVHSLRDWLTRKQKETRRGRAELLLADRAAVWNSRPENRQLPSLLQWLQIKGLTRKKNWTPPQKSMMRKAGQYQLVRSLFFLILLVAGTFTGLEIHRRVVERDNATQATGLVRSLLDAEISQVPGIITELEPYREWSDPLLREASEDAKKKGESRKQLHTSLALLPVDATQVDYLFSRLLNAEPPVAPVIRNALASKKDQLLVKLWTVAEKPARGQEHQQLSAACALASYDAPLNEERTERWQRVSPLIADELVTAVQKNPSHYATLLDQLRPVRARLLTALTNVYRSNERTDSERSFATSILLDYAADQPDVLARLLMDADQKQFSQVYQRFKVRAVEGLPALTGEIAKQIVEAKDKLIFESQGEIVDHDAKVKGMPAKRYEVRLQGGKSYRLTMDSKNLDSFLLLQDKAGNELAFDNDGGGKRNSLLTYVPTFDDTYIIFSAALKPAGSPRKEPGSFQLKLVQIGGDTDDEKEKLAKRQANAAVALLAMGQADKVWPLLRHRPDPRLRSYLIHQLGPYGANAATIIERFEVEPDLMIRRALILSLGEFSEKELSPERRHTVTQKLQAIYLSDDDPGLHAASEWLLRTWKQEAWLTKINDEWANDKEQRAKRLEHIQQKLTREKEKNTPQWYVNSLSQTLVVIPGPVEFMMGSPLTEAERPQTEWRELQHRRKIARNFAIAATPVTKEQFLRFNPTLLHTEVRRYPDPSCPMGGITWTEGGAYCNWLSKAEGIPENQWCYSKDGEPKANYLHLTGYRLPTEAEWEYATRAGAVTARFFGETEELMPKYVWYAKNSQERTWPVGIKKPNDLGLFDMLGNIGTWCLGSFGPFPQGDRPTDDNEEDFVMGARNGFVCRGGSYANEATGERSAARSSAGMSDRPSRVGIRPARTLIP